MIELYLSAGANWVAYGGSASLFTELFKLILCSSGTGKFIRFHILVLLALLALDYFNSLACYRVLVQSNPVDINHVIPWHGDVLGIKADLNQVDWVRFGLEHGADPNLNLIEEYKTPLAAAAECGNEEMVKLMLDYRTQAQGSGAIVLAAAGGHTSIVKLLLSNGADINETGIRGPPGDEWKDDMASPLHKAAANGHIKTIHFLIDAGANADIEDGQGRTPEAVAMAHG
ncbi:ankyrin repeat domain-containing protein [Aspergillus thermomutatus]|uniref:Uncharacterized protein n=1 Tax=Aspergillus thermomutatus TaxID=41047 RepID=A0A397HFT8_ASPTH|nr:uncharacterized protein CDV56_108679 [Aspergillus thermomutatus]RHZ61827.1 hypothetical protein CDV56_108679 [Aspergillus thermomutatus]